MEGQHLQLEGQLADLLLRSNFGLDVSCLKDFPGLPHVFRFLLLHSSHESHILFLVAPHYGLCHIAYGHNDSHYAVASSISAACNAVSQIIGMLAALTAVKSQSSFPSQKETNLLHQLALQICHFCLCRSGIDDESMASQLGSHLVALQAQILAQILWESLKHCVLWDLLTRFYGCQARKVLSDLRVMCKTH